MDEVRKTNSAELRGSVLDKPVFSHESRGIRFFRFTLEVSRLSGAVDIVNVIARESLIRDLEVTSDEKLYVVGELRSFNNRSGSGNKLMIYIYAKELSFDTGEDMNLIVLHGTLCKDPQLRTTPLGREICDMMLAANRNYGRSDYIPCISWGGSAQSAGGWSVGDAIGVAGRLQSRVYTKNIDGDLIEKTAYEVSVTEFIDGPGLDGK